MPGSMMQIIPSKFYIKVSSSDTYTQQNNKCEGQIKDFWYQSKLLIINTKAPDLIWYLCIVTESEVMSSMSIGGRRSCLEVFTGESADISKYT